MSCGDFPTYCESKSFSGNFQTQDPPCDQAGNQPCIYFSVAGLSPRWQCALHPPSGQGNYNTACNAFGLAAFDDEVDSGEFSGLSVGYRDDGPYSGAWSPRGNFDAARFIVPGTPEFRLLLKPITLLVDPCNRIAQYCPQGTVGEQWLGRIVYVDRQGWEVWCNTAKAAFNNPWYEEPCRQLFDRPFALAPAGQTEGFIFVFFNLSSGHCFPLANHHCFVADCPQPASTARWDCIGSTHPDGQVLGRAVDRLMTDWNLRYSTDQSRYPQNNPYEIALKNNAMAFWAKHIDQIDAPGHSSSSSDHRGPQPFRWTHTETYDVNHPDVQQGAILPFPAMTYEADVESPVGAALYGGGVVGQVVELTGHAWLSGVDYPCIMRLHSCNVILHLYAERRIMTAGEDEWRVYGDITVYVIYRCALTAEAYDVTGPFQFLRRPENIAAGDLEAQFDLRFEDPANPGQAHPVERLIVHGPNRERVPAHQDLSHPTRPTLLWRGLRAPMPFGIGGDWFTPCNTYAGGSGVSPCCGAYQAVEANPIHGLYNDLGETLESGPLEQRYGGWVRFRVPWLNDGGGGTVGALCKCNDFGYDRTGW